jgi:predicted dienelactone hydrolase
VVIHPTHNDSLLLKRSKGEKIDLEAFRSKGTRGKVDPMDRHADIIFILDSLDTVEEKVPALRVASGPEKNAPKIGIIDRERIGMSGHSAGAYTTQLIAGVKARGRRVDSPLALKSMGDPRIKASIVISGQGLTTLSLGKESWNELDKPMLVISGSKDVSSVSDETPESRRHPFEYAKPGDKYLIFIEGATHSSYAGRARVSALLGEGEPTDIKMIGGVTSAGTTAFWDAYLKNDAAAKKYLAGEELVKFSGNRAELKRK